MKKITFFVLLFSVLIVPPLVNAQGLIAKVISISPSSGPVGTWVKITGENLHSDCSEAGTLLCNMTVCFGKEEDEACARNTDIPPTVEWSNNLVRAMVPSGAITGPIYLLYRHTYPFGGGQPGEDRYLVNYRITGPTFTLTSAIAPQKEQWELSLDSQELTIYTLTQYRDKLFAGLSGSSGEIYAFDNQRWTKIYSVPSMSFEASIVFKDVLYFVGIEGRVGNYKGSIHVYDGNNWYRVWNDESPLNGLTIFQDKLYVFSGKEGLLVNKTGNPYDWQYLPNSPHIGVKKGVVLNGKLYLAHGREIWIFDGENWERVDIPENILPLFPDYWYPVDVEIYEGKLFILINVVGKGLVAIYDSNPSSVEKWSYFDLPVYDETQLSHVLKVYQDKLFIGVGTARRPAKIYFYQNGRLGISFISNDDAHVYSLGVYRGKFFCGTGLPARVYKREIREISKQITLETIKLFREKGKAGVYAINEETKEKMPIIDKTVFELNNLKWTAVKEVEKSELEKYQTTKPVGLPENTLVKTADKPTVYVAKESELKPITSPSVFVKEGYKWKDIKVVPEKVINLHNIGEVLK